MSFNVTGASLIADGVEYIVVARGQTGFVLFGPYDAYEPGRYHVTFSVLPAAEEVGRPDDLVAVVDVAADEGRTILSTGKVFRRRSTERGGKITLPFELTERRTLEFRVQSTGRAGFIVQSERRVESHPDDRSRFCPVFAPGDVPDSGFVDRFFGNIRYVHEHGLDLSIEGDTASVVVDGILLRIASAEDFQVLDEVFIRNDYRYDIGQDHIVIDVGMNVGFASLFFAGNARAQAVYSFEPFAQPYDRGVANIARNPALATKITAYHFGLSDHDEATSVNTVDGFTLGMTLKGLDRGSPEAIEVRSASTVLRPLINEARACNLAVVLKLDCEGSEFPIFRSLIDGDLLRHVDIVMIEWHKEWSPDLNQNDLIGPMRAAGFVVFDHTVAASQIAGMLYAVRRA